MKNEVKLIALDLDSTLLYNRKFANAHDLEVLKNLQEKGYQITISTGQSYDTASIYAKQIGIDQYINKMVCQNGAYITTVDEFKPESIHTVDDQITKKLIKHFEEKKIPAIFLKYDEFDKYYYLNIAEADLAKMIGRKSKAILITDEINLTGISFVWLRLGVNEDEDFLKKVEELFPNQLALTSSYTDDQTATEIMISDLHANKGERLVDLASQFKFQPNEILAFGDGGNDVSMFKRVKYSVAMGNAKQSVKDQAVYVTDACYDSGVANFLKKHF